MVIFKEAVGKREHGVLVKALLLQPLVILLSFSLLSLSPHLDDGESLHFNESTSIQTVHFCHF